MKLRLFKAVLGMLALLSPGVCFGSDPGPQGLPDATRFEPPLRNLIDEAVKAVNRDPGKALAWGKLAMVCHAHFLRAEARHAYSEAAKLAPSDPRWPHLLGVLSDQLSLTDEAASAFSRALELHPLDVVALCSLARIRQERGQDDEARKLFLEAVKMEPNCAAARVGLGQLALRAGILDMAEKNVRMALEEFPRCGPAHAALAQICAKQGKAEEAAFHRRWGQAGPSRIPLPDPLLEEVEGLGASYEARMQQGHLLASLGQWQEAVERFRAAAGLKDGLAEPRYFLGVSLLQAGETDAGLSELEKVAMKDRQVDAWIRIARARESRGDVTGAHAAIDAGLKLAPESAEALVARGELSCREKKLDLGLADFERAIALEPGNAGAHLAKGQALLLPGATREEAGRDPVLARCEAERARASLASFRRALELKVDLAEAYEGAGKACMQQWDYAREDAEKAAHVEAAVEHFQLAVKCFPERKSAHVALIKALFSAGRVEESVAAIRRARTRWPDDPRFHERTPPAEEK